MSLEIQNAYFTEHLSWLLKSGLKEILGIWENILPANPQLEIVLEHRDMLHVSFPDASAFCGHSVNDH